MGKLIVIILATCAAMALIFKVAGSHLSTTAVAVPGSENVPTFNITWTLIVGGVVGFAIWRVVKGK